MLEMAIASLSRVLTGVDALEELVTKDLPERLQSQSDAVRECHQTRIFLTEWPDVGGAVQKYITATVAIGSSAKMDGMRSRLGMWLDKYTGPVVEKLLRGRYYKTFWGDV